MNIDKIRNIAISAHVDHGKTILVDEVKTLANIFQPFLNILLLLDLLGKHPGLDISL